MGGRLRKEPEGYTEAVMDRETRKDDELRIRSKEKAPERTWCLDLSGNSWAHMHWTLISNQASKGLGEAFTHRHVVTRA